MENVKNTNNENALTEATILSKKEERAILLQNNITDAIDNITVTEKGVTLDNVALTEKDMTFNEDGFKDLSVYKNLNNPVLEKQIAKIQKYRADIRLSLVNIGGVLFDIRTSGSYKKSLKDLGIKSKEFAVFCKEAFGLPKTTTYRYLGVYMMSADIEGKVDKRIALLSNAQLFALYKAKVKHDEIVALLDAIDGIEDVTELETAIADGVKQLTTKQYTKDADADADADADTNADTNAKTDMHKPITNAVMFKCTQKNANPLFIPFDKYESDNWDNVYKFIVDETDYHFANSKHEDIDVAFAQTKLTDFIILTDGRNILTYYHGRKTE